MPSKSIIIIITSHCEERRDFVCSLNGTACPKKKEIRISNGKRISEDLSEAVRSEDILKVLEKELNYVHYADTSGTLLQPLLNGITANFEMVPGGDRELERLIEMEKKMLRDGEIGSDYMFCIAGKTLSESG
ncbi:MAG: hypothetical protein JXA71_16215 [Chitinispirillaceae bacterium]|nr:hypothetical protein [Chitinispirillaceae bacterium]